MPARYDADAAFETAICGFNFGDLLLREIGAIFGDGALLLEIQKMAPVRRQRFDEIHRDRMLDDFALAREIARQTPGDWRGDPNEFPELTNALEATR